ncbi:uncharacterized protein [Dermacentor albipictus]|uniref:uncharacterized protein isoform X2 n=1 Tax=Dermacentor albipictus TaxID=60249 RepID=UPI0038FC243E
MKSEKNVWPSNVLSMRLGDKLLTKFSHQYASHLTRLNQAKPRPIFYRQTIVHGPPAEQIIPHVVQASPTRLTPLFTIEEPQSKPGQSTQGRGRSLLQWWTVRENTEEAAETELVQQATCSSIE